MIKILFSVAIKRKGKKEIDLVHRLNLGKKIDDSY